MRPDLAAHRPEQRDGSSSDKNSARSDRGPAPTRRTVYHDDRRPRTWSGCRLGGPAMDSLIHTAERACILVTLTFILAQTGSFTRGRRPHRTKETPSEALLPWRAGPSRDVGPRASGSGSSSDAPAVHPFRPTERIVFMLVLNIQSSPRGAKSASIAVTNAFLDAYQALHSDVTIDTLNVWQENLPDFDSEAIGAKYKGVSHRLISLDRSPGHCYD